MKKVCIITGGTSGIGKCTADCMVKNGYTVYELSRRKEGNANVCHISTDITDENAVQSAVNTVVEKEGKIDVLINNAGFGISGAIEFTKTEDAVRQFNVNFFGAVRMCKAVIPIMRKSGGGRIVNVGSVAGVIPIPFQSYYSAAKAAILSYTLSLENEVRPFGITAVCVQPGDIKTGFTAARKKETAGDDVYSGRISRSVAVMEHDEQNGMSAETAGEFIALTALKKNEPVKTIGFKYKAACLLAKLLPLKILNRIIGSIYAE